MSTNQNHDTVPAEEPKLTREQQEIVIAKKLFYGGCLLLPWLWIVALIYFRKHLVSPTAAPELKRYLYRSTVGTVVITVLFVTWFSLFQTRWSTWGSVGTDLLVVPQDPFSPWW